jgi:hypothetical protein
MQIERHTAGAGLWRPHGKDRGKPTTSVVRKLSNRGLAVTDKWQAAWQKRAARIQGLV